MRAVSAVAAVILGLMGPTTFVAAQSWGGSEYRERERGYRDRDRGYGDRDRDRERGYRERDRGYGERRVEFDERDYLRCNPDVRRAVSRGQFGGSGLAHYREYGRREGRRLTC